MALAELGNIILPPIPAPGGSYPQDKVQLGHWTRQCEQAIRKLEAYLHSLKAALETLTGGSSHGLPVGGSTSQVLAKNSATDYDAGWSDPHYVPPGGAVSQVLAKNSATDYDAGWSDPHYVPPGGSTSQVLAKNSATDYDLTWVTPSTGGGASFSFWGSNHRGMRNYLLYTISGTTVTVSTQNTAIDMFDFYAAGPIGTLNGDYGWGGAWVYYSGR